MKITKYIFVTLPVLSILSLMAAGCSSQSNDASSPAAGASAASHMAPVKSSDGHDTYTPKGVTSMGPSANPAGSNTGPQKK